jgi:EAL domain-containing protein (putative c-di-GMP-specific phosphodiesterase class I)/PAS domain-containing protein
MLWSHWIRSLASANSSMLLVDETMCVQSAFEVANAGETTRAGECSPRVFVSPSKNLKRSHDSGLSIEPEAPLTRFLLRDDFRFEHVSEQLEQVAGKARGLLQLQGLEGLLSNASTVAGAEAWQDSRESGKSFFGELILDHSHFHLWSHPLYSGNGQWCVHLVELFERQQLWEQETSTRALWWWNRRSRRSYWSRGMMDQFGIRVGEFDGNPSTFYSFVDPEHHPLLRRLAWEATQNVDYPDYTAKDRTGRSLVLTGQAYPLRDATGEVISLTGNLLSVAGLRARQARERTDQAAQLPPGVQPEYCLMYWDGDTAVIHQESFVFLTDHDSSAAPTTFSELLAWFLPEERMLIRDALLLCRQQEQTQCICRIRSRGDGIRWLQLRFERLNTAAGDAVPVLVTALDVTQSEHERIRSSVQATHNAQTGLFELRALLDILRERHQTMGYGGIALLSIRLHLAQGAAMGAASPSPASNSALTMSQVLDAALPASAMATSTAPDEFLVALSGVEGQPEATRQAEEIMEQLQRSTAATQGIRATIGLALADSPFLRPEDLMRRAEAARLRASEIYSHRPAIFVANRDFVHADEIELQREIPAALENGQFKLLLQPIRSVNSLDPVMQECLLRWEHPERGLLGAGLFLSSAERGPVIEMVDEWVLDEVARRQASSLAHAPWAPLLPLTVNLSARSLIRPRAARRVLDKLSQYGLPAHAIAVELVETVLISDMHYVQQQLKELRGQGVKVLLDDFGSGYSSLGYLAQLPLSGIKVDGSLIRAAENSARDYMVLRAIAGMARGLQLDLIGEGVESEQQLRILRELNFDALQGWLFDKPLH